MNRSWIYIFIGVLFEVIWVTGFKHATDVWTWAATVVSLIVSFALIISASAKLPVGTVYAVFTGLGTVGTVVVEMVMFDEPARPLKLVLIAILLAGVIGLKVIGGESPADHPKEAKG
ncbi:multidrug efflux SMR transporter [Paenibacillus antri]|uniref:Multidrug efflux SMR transporter n=1 Tax=Paenibacillus antri TaxID=2582848 RepID=A0A5R9GHJ2_9BACL|nr:multidrug efflux SMR transporter [Paenibacillus antri]TLS53680.1 multidrug efflux SMR transporter [Paenibacillus antri]